jgi:hypothetical protein
MGSPGHALAFYRHFGLTAAEWKGSFYPPARSQPESTLAVPHSVFSECGDSQSYAGVGGRRMIQDVSEDV